MVRSAVVTVVVLVLCWFGAVQLGVDDEVTQVARWAWDGITWLAGKVPEAFSYVKENWYSQR